MNAFEACGVKFLETVNTPNGKGIVQGIIRDAGVLRVIVSHTPSQMPPEVIPARRMWKLVYYDPSEINKESNENGR